MNRSLYMKTGNRRARALFFWKTRWRQRVVLPFYVWLERVLGARIITAESLQQSFFVTHEAFILNVLKPGDYDSRAAQHGEEHHWVQEHEILDFGKKFGLSVHTIRITLHDLVRSGNVFTAVRKTDEMTVRVYARTLSGIEQR